jgi:hypothetical protein
MSACFSTRLLLPAVLLLSCLSLRAEIIYDNSSSGGSYAYYTLNEYGDEVVLGGTNRVVTQFLFEYYGDFTPTGNETGRLRLYLNDGPKTSTGDPTPGTVLFDSGSFGLSTNYSTKSFSGLKIPVPNDFTWTVQFSGLVNTSGDEAGLIFRDPPTVGSSPDDVWIKENGTWGLFDWQSHPIANFAARIIAADPTVVSIRTSAQKAIVEWTGLSILQAADKPDGPFTDLIPNPHNRYETAVGSSRMKFFRLRD